MTSEELQAIRHLPLFPSNAEELIQVAGLQAAARLISAWPGQEFPVPAVVGGGNPRGTRRWEQLVEVVGPGPAERILGRWRGGMLYVPSCKEALWSQTQDKIRAHYDRLTTKEGYSHPEAVFELGITYNVSGRGVERILAEPDNPGVPDLGKQLGLFDIT